MAHVDARYRVLYTRLKDSLSDFTAEQVSAEREGEKREQLVNALAMCASSAGRQPDAQGAGAQFGGGAVWGIATGHTPTHNPPQSAPPHPSPGGPACDLPSRASAPPRGRTRSRPFPLHSPHQTTVQDLLETCVDVLERMPVSGDWWGVAAPAGAAGLLLLLFLLLPPTRPAAPSRAPSPLPQALASASSYGSLESAVPGLRSRLVARQLESVDALVRALQEALCVFFGGGG